MIQKGEWSSEKSDREGGSAMPQDNELELNPIPSSLAPNVANDYETVPVHIATNSIVPEIDQPNEVTETYDEKNKRE